LDVLPAANGRPRVYFASAVGSAWAYWSNGQPVPGTTYYVELSAGDPLVWGVDIVPVADAAPRIESAGDGVTIYAPLESCEADGFTTLRLGDSLMMLETMGDPPASDPEGAGAIGVRAHVRTLTLFDTHI